MTIYHVISVSEDGDVSLTRLTGTELKARLDSAYWGTDVDFHNLVAVRAGTHLDTQSRVDLRLGPAGIYIIRGDAFIPEPKKIVHEWDVPE